jgi:hypothetical protein
VKYDCKERRQKRNKEREERKKANNQIENYLYDAEYLREEKNYIYYHTE